jgi:uncharacterized protein (TIGR02246 family)
MLQAAQVRDGKELRKRVRPMWPQKRLLACLWCAVLLAAIASPAGAQTPARADDELAIRAAITAMTEAFNAHDAKALSRLCTKDVQFVTARGELMNGVAEVENGLTTLFLTRNRTARARTLNVAVRFIKDDVAVAHVTNEVAGVVGSDAQVQPLQREFSLRVFVRDSGNWRLTAFHNTFLPG